MTAGEAVCGWLGEPEDGVLPGSEGAGAAAQPTDSARTIHAAAAVPIRAVRVVRGLVIT